MQKPLLRFVQSLVRLPQQHLIYLPLDVHQVPEVLHQDQVGYHVQDVDAGHTYHSDSVLVSVRGHRAEVSVLPLLHVSLSHTHARHPSYRYNLLADSTHLPQYHPDSPLLHLQGHVQQ